MSTFSQFTSQVKSVQRGTATIGVAVQTVNQTITAVDLNKAVVIATCRTAGEQANYLATAKLTSATNVQCTKGIGGLSASYVEWQVIEYY